ncbi:MAG: RNA polymerase sigma factor [Myxococcota bacterium]
MRNPPEEAEIDRHVRAGDVETAMRALMDMHGGVVLAFCRRFTDSEAEARDLRQVVFIEAYRDLSSFQGRSTWRTWLLSIARNRALDRRKADRRRAARLAVVEAQQSSAVDEGPADRLALRSIIDRCLGELSVPNREVVWLRHIIGLRYEEIAAVVRASTAAAQMRVARSLRSLRQCLDTHGARA